MILSKEQLESELSYQDYLDMVLKSDMIKYEHGLVEQLTIDKDNTNILKNGLAIGKSHDTFEVIYQNIKNDTGITDNSQFSFKLYHTPKRYDKEIITLQFLENNSSYHQLQNYIRSYQNYLGSAGTYSYTAYKQTELRIEEYQLKYKELEANIKAYVKAAIKSYDTALSAKEAAWKELLLKSKKCEIIKLKLDYKRASKLELQQAIYEKEAAEVNYLKCCYDIVIWQDIIENCIYGASPDD